MTSLPGDSPQKQVSPASGSRSTSTLKHVWTPASISELVEKADLDGDGSLDRAEFAVMWRRKVKEEGGDDSKMPNDATINHLWDSLLSLSESGDQTISNAQFAKLLQNVYGGSKQPVARRSSADATSRTDRRHSIPPPMATPPTLPQTDASSKARTKSLDLSSASELASLRQPTAGKYHSLSQVPPSPASSAASGNYPHSVTSMPISSSPMRRTRSGSLPKKQTPKKEESEGFFSRLFSPSKKKLADSDKKDEELSPEKTHINDMSFLASELGSTETTSASPASHYRTSSGILAPKASVPQRRRAHSMGDVGKESEEAKRLRELTIHLQNIKSVFRKFDKLNNGCVFLSEFADVVRYLYPDAPIQDITDTFSKIDKDSSGDFDFETNAHKLQARLNALQYTPNFAEFLQATALTYQSQERPRKLPTRASGFNLEDDPIVYAQALGHDCNLYMVEEGLDPDKMKTIANQLWQWIAVHGIPAITENRQLQKENEELKQDVDDLKQQLAQMQGELQCEKLYKEENEKASVRLAEECATLREQLERMEDMNNKIRMELSHKSQLLKQETDDLKQTSEQLEKALTELKDFKSKYEDSEQEKATLTDINNQMEEQLHEDTAEIAKLKESLKEPRAVSLTDIPELSADSEESDPGADVPIAEEFDTGRDASVTRIEFDSDQTPSPRTGRRMSQMRMVEPLPLHDLLPMDTERMDDHSDEGPPTPRYYDDTLVPLGEANEKLDRMLLKMDTVKDGIDNVQGEIREIKEQSVSPRKMAPGMFDDVTDAQLLAGELRELKRSHAEQRDLLANLFDFVKTSVATKRDTEARDGEERKGANDANILDALAELTHSTGELASIQKTALEKMDQTQAENKADNEEMQRSLSTLTQSATHLAQTEEGAREEAIKFHSDLKQSLAEIQAPTDDLLLISKSQSGALTELKQATDNIERELDADRKRREELAEVGDRRATDLTTNLTAALESFGNDLEQSAESSAVIGQKHAKLMTGLIESVERIGEVSEKTKESVGNVRAAISDVKLQQASASAPLPQGDDSEPGAVMRTAVDPTVLVEAVSDKIARQLEKLEDNLRREHLNELKTNLSVVCKEVCGEETEDVLEASVPPLARNVAAQIDKEFGAKQLAETQKVLRALEALQSQSELNAATVKKELAASKRELAEALAQNDKVTRERLDATQTAIQESVDGISDGIGESLTKMQSNLESVNDDMKGVAVGILQSHGQLTGDLAKRLEALNQELGRQLAAEINCLAEPLANCAKEDTLCAEMAKLSLSTGQNQTHNEESLAKLQLAIAATKDNIEQLTAMQAVSSSLAKTSAAADDGEEKQTVVATIAEVMKPIHVALGKVQSDICTKADLATLQRNVADAVKAEGLGVTDAMQRKVEDSERDVIAAMNSSVGSIAKVSVKLCSAVGGIKETVEKSADTLGETHSLIDAMNWSSAQGGDVRSVEATIAQMGKETEASIGKMGDALLAEIRDKDLTHEDSLKGFGDALMSKSAEASANADQITHVRDTLDKLAQEMLQMTGETAATDQKQSKLINELIENVTRVTEVSEKTKASIGHLHAAVSDMKMMQAAATRMKSGTEEDAEAGASTTLPVAIEPTALLEEMNTKLGLQLAELRDGLLHEHLNEMKTKLSVVYKEVCGEESAAGDSRTFSKAPPLARNVAAVIEKEIAAKQLAETQKISRQIEELQTYCRNEMLGGALADAVGRLDVKGSGSQLPLAEEASAITTTAALRRIEDGLQQVTAKMGDIEQKQLQLAITHRPQSRLAPAKASGESLPLPKEKSAPLAPKIDALTKIIAGVSKGQNTKLDQILKDTAAIKATVDNVLRGSAGLQTSLKLYTIAADGEKLGIRKQIEELGQGVGERHADVSERITKLGESVATAKTSADDSAADALQQFKNMDAIMQQMHSKICQTVEGNAAKSTEYLAQEMAKWSTQSKTDSKAIFDAQNQGTLALNARIGELSKLVPEQFASQRRDIDAKRSNLLKELKQCTDDSAKTVVQTMEERMRQNEEISELHLGGIRKVCDTLLTAARTSDKTSGDCLKQLEALRALFGKSVSDNLLAMNNRMSQECGESAKHRAVVKQMLRESKAHVSDSAEKSSAALGTAMADLMRTQDDMLKAYTYQVSRELLKEITGLWEHRKDEISKILDQLTQQRKFDQQNFETKFGAHSEMTVRRLQGIGDRMDTRVDGLTRSVQGVGGNVQESVETGVAHGVTTATRDLRAHFQDLAELIPDGAVTQRKLDQLLRRPTAVIGSGAGVLSNAGKYTLGALFAWLVMIINGLCFGHTNAITPNGF